ncbi:MAG: amino acid decarboxylase [Anaerolineae bacterium]|nr:amino acid decarboxylase [Anaerolineae bacterium]
MNLEQFRQYGHEMIDWIADYLSHPERYPVLSPTQPGEIKGQLPSAPPEQPETMAAIWQDFQQIILSGITHWNHPGFMAYFANTAAPPGILAELLAAALNVNGMLWRTSPAATELEEVTLDWLRQLLGLSDEWQGVITDSASMSSLLAIAAAREATNLAVRTLGMSGRDDLPRLRLYISDQTHSSVEKGAITLGLGQENAIKIPTDEQFQMRPELLEAAIQADINAGHRPFFVCATVGTTSTTSIDPVPAVAEITARYGLWLHVDGAYGGAAAILPEMRHILAGTDKADSFVVNPHKWLLTPLDCSTLYVRRPDILKNAFSILPEYLRSAETDAQAVINYMDYGVQLGRRFRALKLWFVLRSYGQSGLQQFLRHHIEMAQTFARWVDESPQFERLAPTPLSTVCFRASPPGVENEETLNALNEMVMNRVNERGQVFLSHTKLRGRYTLRLAIGNLFTQESHIAEAWAQLQEAVGDWKIERLRD